MILRRLEVEAFRKYRMPAQIEFDPKFTVVSGLNEAGKTTLFRALQYAFFRRSGTNATDVKSLRPWGTSGLSPRVVVEFYHDGRELRLAKVFGANGTSTLDERMADGTWQAWKGDGTDDYIAEIFAGEPPGKGAFKDFKAEHLGLAHLLFAPQGRTAIEAADDDQLAPHAQEHVGALIGQAMQTQAEVRLREKVKERRNASWTKGGKLKRNAGTLALAEEITLLEQQIQVNIEELQGLEAAAREFAQLEEQSTQLQTLYDTARLEVDASRPRFQMAIEFKSALERAEAEYAVADKAYTEVLGRSRRVAQLDESIAAVLRELKACQTHLVACESRLTEARGQEEARRAELSHVNAPDDEVEQLKRRLTLRLEEEHLAGEDAQLATMAANLQRVEDRIAELQTRLANAPSVSSQDIDDVNAATQKRKELAERIAAATTRLRFTASKTISVDFEADGKSRSRRLETLEFDEISSDGPISLVIPEIGTVTALGPFGKDVNSERQALRSLDVKLETLQTRFGTLDLATLAQRAALHDQLADAQRAAQADRRTAAGELTMAAIARRRSEIASERDRLAAIAEIAISSDELRRRLEDIQTAAESRQRQALSRADDARAALEIEQIAFQTAEKTRMELEKRLSVERAKRDMEAPKKEQATEFEAMIDELFQKRDAAQRRLEQRKSAFEPFSDLPDPKAELEQAERKVRAYENAVRQNKSEIESRRARIEETQRRAPSAEVAVLEAKLTVKREQHRRVSVDEAAAALVYDLLEKQAESQKASIAAPVVQVIGPWARRVIDRPVDSVAFNGAFAAGTLRLDGSDSDVEWHDLSKGTTDQLGVLIRMAFAKLLSQRGEGSRVPLILDDPLVNCDQVRLPRLLRLLEELSESVQVIAFTCRPTDYATARATITAIETLSTPQAHLSDSIGAGTERARRSAART